MLNVLFYLCFSAMLLSGVFLWWSAFKQKKSHGCLMLSRPSEGSPLGLIDVIAAFFIWILTQLIAIGLVQASLGLEANDLSTISGDKQSWVAIVLGCSQIVATVASLVYFWIRYRNLSAIGLRWSTAGADFKLGLVLFVMVVPAILLLQWLLVQLLAYKHPTMEMLAKNANGLTLVAAWVSAVLAAPVFEEVFFRGFLQAWLQRLGTGAADCVVAGGWDSSSKLQQHEVAKNTDPSSSANSDFPSGLVDPQKGNSVGLGSSRTSDSIWPILVTSGLFALAHVGQGPAPIPLFFFGIALGYVFRRTNSIIPCIVLHMMLNAFSMFWFTLGVFIAGAESEGVASLLQVLKSVYFL